MKLTFSSMVLFFVFVQFFGCGKDNEEPSISIDAGSDLSSDIGSDIGVMIDEGMTDQNTVDQPSSETVEVSVGLDDLANCDDICGGQSLVCSPSENFLGILVAGTAQYGPGSTTYVSRCDRLPRVEEPSIDGELEMLTSYTCNCGTSA